ncbi:MAG: PHP domain-containing protein [Thermoleophilia bacterium]|jgi:predicted metal-dependent phosphoesterase TrpH
MRVDLHVHTYPASSCSTITYRDLIACCRERRLGAIALTNHGDVSDNRRLEGPLAERGTVLVHGVEISTPCGDFIVYSPDLDYLAGFKDIQAMPQAGTIAGDAAMVWVHPGAGGGRSGSLYHPGLTEHVAPLIDAVEVWNGNWTDARYVAAAERLVDTLGLPATGGSDAHRVDRVGHCVTEIDGDVRSTADVVAAIRSGAVAPVAPPAPRGAARGVGHLFDLFRH